MAAGTWEKAATWMDDVRSDHKYDYMKSWHYINVERDKTYVVEPNAENCIVEIQKAITELNNKSNLNHEQISMDIKLFTIVRLKFRRFPDLTSGYLPFC